MNASSKISSRLLLFFATALSSRDAALLLTLPPGAYMAMVRGAQASDAGEVLVEVYFVQ